MSKLHISADLSLPKEAVTETFAILAKRGMGKTYTMLVMAEEMLKADAQVIIADPVGVCWGLRSSADGKGPGLPIIVMGGDHRDVPLEETAGELIADFVIENRASVVLDMSRLRKNAQVRFMTDFSEKLYHRNRSPLHLFLDEADAFAPQKPQHGQEKMLGAVEDLVRRGRARGIGVTMVTQRSAVLNKDVLTQIEVLIALRTISPQDRSAIKAWIEVHGDADKEAIVMDSLASLPKGTTWFWSPGWLDILKRVQIRKRETFDSSATPEFGRLAKRPIKLAEVDLESLKVKMSATIERAKQDDPRELRKQIAQLKLDLAKRPTEQKVIEKPIEVKVPVWTDKQIEKLSHAAEQLRESSIRIFSAAAIASPPKLIPKVEHRSAVVFKPRAMGLTTTISTKVPRVAAESNGKLRDGAERMLAALCQWHPNGMTWGQVRTYAGLKKSGTSSTYQSEIRKYGYVQENDGLVYATEAAITKYGSIAGDAPTTTAGVVAVWSPKLRAGAVRMLEVLVSHKGDLISREQLAEESGLSNSGTFSTYLGELKTSRLAVVERGGVGADKVTLLL